MTPHQLPMTVTSKAAHNRHQDDEGQGGMSQADMRIYQLTKIMMEEERDMHNMVRMEYEGTYETDSTQTFKSVMSVNKRVFRMLQETTQLDISK